MITFDQMLEVSVKNQDKLRKISKPLYEVLPINYFFAQFHSRCGKFGCLGTHVDFMCDFFEASMPQKMPFITKFNWSSNAFFLVDAMGGNNYECYQKFINEKFSRYKMKHVLSVLRSNQDFCFEYGFGLKNNFDTNVVINHLEFLNKFIDYFNINFSGEMGDMIKTPVCLKSVLGDNYKGQTYSEANLHIPHNKKIQFLEKISSNCDRDLLKVKFTKREIDILRLYDKLNTAREVGESLYLSPRTVQNHIARIKEKLGCSNKSELLKFLKKMHQWGIL